METATCGYFWEHFNNHKVIIWQSISVDTCDDYYTDSENQTIETKGKSTIRNIITTGKNYRWLTKPKNGEILFPSNAADIIMLTA